MLFSANFISPIEYKIGMAQTVTISKQEFDSMKETLDIFSDSGLVKDIKEGIEDIRKGKSISLNEYLDR